MRLMRSQREVVGGWGVGWEYRRSREAEQNVPFSFFPSLLSIPYKEGIVCWRGKKDYVPPLCFGVAATEQHSNGNVASFHHVALTYWQLSEVKTSGVMQGICRYTEYTHSFFSRHCVSIPSGAYQGVNPLLNGLLKKGHKLRVYPLLQAQCNREQSV